MTKHLFVNGTSVAAGWGLHDNTNVTINRDSTWVNAFSEKLNASKTWNISLISKPIEITIDHTIEFCKQYYATYNTYENLFVAVEFTLPQLKKWDAVKLSDRNSDTNVIPIVVQKDTDNIGNSDMGTYYRTVFIKHKREMNYLSDDTLFYYVPDSEIDETDFVKHTLAVEHYSQIPNLLAKRLYESTNEIDFLQQWLSDHNIAYMMFWACGIHPSFHKIVDKAHSSLHNNRFIPMSNFTAFSKGAEWSDNPYQHHPDEAGHYKIGEFLFDYASEHKLFQKPNKDMIEN